MKNYVFHVKRFYNNSLLKKLSVFDLDFLRSPQKSMKNEDYANANPDFF